MSDNSDEGVFGVFIIGIIFGALVTWAIFIWGIGTAYSIKHQYRECIALGAPADNCLKEYVLEKTDNQKGE